ncbi:MAG: hypothetical protein ACK5GN_14115 [Pseudomonadota bacterium]|jgi:hypothetical protein
MRDPSAVGSSGGVTEAASIRGFALNGPDAFMVAMDRDMRRNGSVGNICHLLVTLPRGVALAPLCRTIEGTDLYAYLKRLRLFAWPFRTPRWRLTRSGSVEALSASEVRSEGDLHEWILGHRVDLQRAGPFGIVSLPSYIVGPSLLFYWHHALCDAHGGERLVQRLVEGAQAEVVVPKGVPADSIRESLTRVRRAKALVFAKASGEIARISADSSAVPQNAYIKARFSQADTARVDQTSVRLTGGIFSSAMYIASTARAYAAVTGDTRPLFIPVPHDMRRATRERSPLSNQVSVVFVRLTHHDLSTLKCATNVVIEQLHEAIETGAPRDHLAFLQMLRRFPSALHWRIISIPARGHPASLYVSDVGSGLSTITHISGKPVADVSHYPPNLSPPGLTAVWSRYRSQLELTVCYDQRCLSVERVTRFVDTIKVELVG